jgi:excisionase family DNA binding protein
MTEEWLTTEQAAELSGYHPNHIRRLLRAREIDGRKWGQAWQVNRQSLLGYVERVEETGNKRGPKSE